jgi:hypothetical protein
MANVKRIRGNLDEQGRQYAFGRQDGSVVYRAGPQRPAT